MNPEPSHGFSAYCARFVVKLIRRFAWPEFSAAVNEVRMHQPRVYGDPARLKIHPTAQVNDALFNLGSGTISIAEEVFFGHGVSVLTGRHDPDKIGLDRRDNFPRQGGDIVIERGAWVASNVTILGPCRIGENAVVGAHSLVLQDVPANSIVAGVPTRLLRQIKPASS